MSDIQFDAPEARAQVRSLLREHGLRSTRQREDVFLALATSDGHLSADEVYRTVAMSHAGMSLATVYNTLEALAGAGLCIRMLTSGGKARYDADVSDHAHVITVDGRVMDVPHELSDRLLNSINPALLAEVEQCLGIRLSGLSLELKAENLSVDPLPGANPSSDPEVGSSKDR